MVVVPIVTIPLIVVVVLVQLGTIFLEVAFSSTLKAPFVVTLLLPLILLRLLTILIGGVCAPAILCNMTRLVAPMTVAPGAWPTVV